MRHLNDAHPTRWAEYQELNNDTAREAYLQQVVVPDAE